MKSIVKQSNKKAAFTIVELLTVMSIIVILFSLLVPALNMVRRYAKRVKQNAQFHSIDAAMQLFNSEFEGYPPSGQWDSTGAQYPGAMKLAEAMVGQDLLGFNPDSLFRADGINPALTPPYDDLYPSPFNPQTDPVHAANLRSRKGPYLPVEGANLNTLYDLYGPGNFLTFNTDPNGGVVLCDEYPRVRNRTTGKKVGMPILYYRADTSKTLHKYSADNSTNIYNCDDNLDLIDLGLPWNILSVFDHPMSSFGGLTPDNVATDPGIFYEKTRNKKISAMERPCRSDSYILISAGYDGLYGTDDDVFNFGN